jgi:cell fate regulator YaaT (PSP1 superfamily)
MLRIVSLKFRIAGKHYDFNAQDLPLQAGEQVVVETDRGRALAIVVAPPREVPASQAPPDLKSVLRLATDEDRALAASNATREREAFKFCQARIQERKMEMKLVRAEYLFDGSKVVFYFTADGRVDFRELVKDLAHYFHTRIEMRQIGVRDEAKLTGGLGICGRELCCCTFLVDFAPVSVKMAKEQGLALNPNKISGQCGRLLCCLAYEYETYCSLKKALPKCGRKITLGEREAEVIEQSVLAQRVTVRLDDGSRMQLTAAQVEGGEMPTPDPAAASARPARPKREPREPRETRENRPGRGKPAAKEERPAERKIAPAPKPKPEPVPPAEPAADQDQAARKSSSRRRRRRPKRT